MAACRAMVQVTEPIMQAMRHRMNADLMFHPATLGAEPSVFASDDTAAQATVTGPLGSIGHTDVIDLGNISAPRHRDAADGVAAPHVRSGSAAFDVRNRPLR